MSRDAEIKAMRSAAAERMRRHRHRDERDLLTSQSTYGDLKSTVSFA
jgi:hypothetical protein